MVKEGEKPTDSDVSKDKLEGVEYLLRKLERLEKENRGLRGMNARNKPKEPEIKSDEPQTEPEKAPGPHYVKPYDRFCTDCGGPNPTFKDEMICDKEKGGCGKHLGSVADVAKLKACPDCGGTSAKALRGLTPEEKLLFAK